MAAIDWNKYNDDDFFQIIWVLIWKYAMGNSPVHALTRKMSISLHPNSNAVELSLWNVSSFQTGVSYEVCLTGRFQWGQLHVPWERIITEPNSICSCTNDFTWTLADSCVSVSMSLVWVNKEHPRPLFKMSWSNAAPAPLWPVSSQQLQTQLCCLLLDKTLLFVFVSLSQHHNLQCPGHIC